MISHKYKCIFIHIQRTAGSSIEKWMCGKDWWHIEPETKHLLASQAREVYSKYWDDYYKFSFVRNPWDRVVSCLKFSKYFGITYNSKLDLETYKQRFGFPKMLEVDNRYYKKENIVSEKHQSHAVYQNIIDEDLDFVGRFENLEQDANFLREQLGIEKKFNVNKQHNKTWLRKKYHEYYDAETKAIVHDIYRKDIEKYGYTF